MGTEDKHNISESSNETLGEYWDKGKWQTFLFLYSMLLRENKQTLGVSGKVSFA